MNSLTLYEISQDYLQTNMQAAGITRIESPWFCIAIQNNPGALEIFDKSSLPGDFETEVVTIKIDKAAIKQAIRDGAEIPGIMLSQGTRLAIR